MSKCPESAAWWDSENARARARLGLVFAMWLSFTPAIPARAQTTETIAQSNQWFDTAKKQQAAGKLAEACESFARSYELAPRGGTLLNLGLCHEQLHELLAAHAELTEALAMARRDGRADREPIALEHIASIEAKLVWLTLVPPENVDRSKLQIDMDGRDVTSTLAAPTLIEAGDHALSIAAPGFQPLRIALSGEPGAKLVVRLDPLRKLELAPALGPVPPSVAALASPQPGVTRSAPAGSTNDRSSAAPWIVIGASSAVAVGGGVLIAVALSDISTVEDGPAGTRNWSSVEPANQRAPTLSTLGFVMLGAGVLGVTAGLVWKFWPDTTDRSGSATLHINPGSVNVRGVL